MKPNLVIYHDHCTDGFAAAFAAHLALGDTAEYLPASYGQDLSEHFTPEKLNDRIVFILDFSFPMDVMNTIQANAKTMIWLDHHKTAFEMMGVTEATPYVVTEPAKRYIHLNNGKSGAMLAWDFFSDTPAPDVIQMIDDRDRWQFKFDNSKALHAGLATMKPWSFEQWETMDFAAVISKGQTLIDRIEQEVKGAAKRARPCNIYYTVGEGEDNPGAPWEWNGKEWLVTGLAVNAASNMSELGNELAVMSKSFGMVYYIDSDNKVRVSLRSVGDYDVSAIAKYLGGGGHRNASGCEINFIQLMGFLA